VWSYGRGGHEQQKREKRDKKEEQHEEQLEEVSLLQSSLCKPTMVVEVCCHCHELSLLTSQRFFKFKKKNYFSCFFFNFFSCFFASFFNTFIFPGISFLFIYLFIPFFQYFMINNHHNKHLKSQLRYHQTHIFGI
jgi:hypothetical protein